MTPRVIASRSSATFLPEKSSPRAADAAVSPAWRAPFCAVCWRPRALPPAFAARLRAGLLLAPLEDDLRADAPEPLRALELERRLDELLEEELVLRLRPLAADFRAPPEVLDALRAPDALALRAPELRALDPLDLRALAPRALDPDALRVDPPPDDLFRDEPPPLPEPVSAIALPPLKLPRR
jgi:hypothetical protein